MEVAAGAEVEGEAGADVHHGSLTLKQQREINSLISYININTHTWPLNMLDQNRSPLKIGHTKKKQMVVVDVVQSGWSHPYSYQYPPYDSPYSTDPPLDLVTIGSHHINAAPNIERKGW